MAVEQAALELYARDVTRARELLTSYTNLFMNKAEKAYWELVDALKLAPVAPV